MYVLSNDLMYVLSNDLMYVLSNDLMYVLIKRPGPGLGVLIFFEANHCEAGVAKCC
jgi:hypothetical protein